MTTIGDALPGPRDELGAGRPEVIRAEDLEAALAAPARGGAIDLERRTRILEPHPADVAALRQSTTPADLLAPARSRSLAQRLTPTSTHAILAVDLVAAVAPIVLLGGGDRGWLLLTAALAAVLCAAVGLYRPQLQLFVLDDAPTILLRWAAALGATSLVMLTLTTPADPRRFAQVSALGALTVCLGRASSYRLVRAVRATRVVGHRALFLGGSPEAAEMATILREDHRYGLQPLGFIDDAGDEWQKTDLGSRLGKVDQLDEIIKTYDVEVLIVAPGATPEAKIVESLRSGHASSCAIYLVPRLAGALSAQGVVDHIGAIPVMRLRGPRYRAALGCAVKRAFDVAASAAAILVFSPVLVACALAVRTTGPDIIFRQQRVGKDGHLFDVLKFRSMRPVSEAQLAAWSAIGDPRITKVGKFLRKTSLDELPQLWNVLRGDMTLVGPRPERPSFVEQFTQEIPDYAHRHRVRGGLTGMAQVSGLRGGSTSIERRARFDNYYIENWSFWLDIKVILRTVREVTGARGG
ncbi:exopolysaccharide biosynthesis polyprenyl glycosylphosphotransferase [Motilibacter rhizosphaerae]|uniref:Exopolysaccharide biosynthesis polyprenyl glycosylphosphotransferase n=1 Tax=Motilibacter rhizosphaerae TaxID=598652 RepID=A0A4Q7NQK1_9ACTN|nr:sugar transferase [Motilibacter rhizosphaerae]RZS87378.1 exopolysaccharide biosynthesis polyprenyl glycosylphosphotransferase [Motilibacter rhizosphaerae]